MKSNGREGFTGGECSVQVNLSAGSKNVTIKIDGSLRGKAGKVAKDDPTTIILSDSAFISEEELACTIAHELAHCREYLAIGKSKEKRPKASEKN